VWKLTRRRIRAGTRIDAATRADPEMPLDTLEA
jgi:hypothetical protein